MNDHHSKIRLLHPSSRMEGFMANFMEVKSFEHSEIK